METELMETRKQMLYDFICSELYVPMKAKEMAVVLNVPKEQRKELKEVLAVLLEDGKIEVSEKGKYKKTEGKFITGTFCAHPKGFGFVAVEGEDEDIFISGDDVNGAMHGDTVKVIPGKSQGGRRKEGVITGIIKHGTTKIVGTYEKSENFGFVVPDNPKYTKDLFILKEHSKGAVSGHKVVAQITDYGKKGKKPEGKIIEILGHINDPGTDILSIIREFELPEEFPERVLNQAERVANEVSGADISGRLDLREEQTVTIDGEDAKDLDDAVTLTMDGENYILGVHIADVTNYVQEHSALDEEAKDRGTSVYLVDRVIPMLPHTLSNGMCSLNQGENRLALSCIMTIDKKGAVIDHRIAETVIRVDRRMSYTAVKMILEDKDPEYRKEYEELVPLFLRMEELAGILRKKRKSRGAVDFDFPETKIVLDKQGRPVELKPYERNAATKIIEDFMLIANETVAEDYFWQELPFVYRTHETPEPDKIRKLRTFVQNFGYTMHVGRDEIHPKEVQKLLQQVEGTPEEALISRLTLRSMRQAKYTPEFGGHFGLATKYYCHFTSPIRRYPDLQIHRIIKENVRGKLSEKRILHYEKILPEVAKHASEMERRADEAERETDKLKKAEYMYDYIGETFEGVISGVTGWGMYVELPNTVEGLVHITSMDDDYYEYREETYELFGAMTNKRYKLGQRVKIVVTAVDMQMHTVDFELAREENGGAGKWEKKALN